MSNLKKYKINVSKVIGNAFSVLVILIAAIIIGLFIVYYIAFNMMHTSSTIAVAGVDGSISEISNKQIQQTNMPNQFKVTLSKDKFFDELKLDYEVFDFDENLILLIINNEVFTVRHCDNYYDIFGNYIGCYYVDKYGNRTYLTFPFPNAKILKTTEKLLQYPDNPTFYISCDIDYLHRFYAVYGDAVQIDGNIIEYTNHNNIKLSLEIDETESKVTIREPG